MKHTDFKWTPQRVWTNVRTFVIQTPIGYKIFPSPQKVPSCPIPVPPAPRQCVLHGWVPLVLEQHAHGVTPQILFCVSEDAFAAMCVLTHTTACVGARSFALLRSIPLQDTPPLVCPFPRLGPFGLFPGWGCYRWSCYKLSCEGILRTCFLLVTWGNIVWMHADPRLGAHCLL